MPRLFNLSCDVEHPEQEYYLQPTEPGRCQSAASFCPMAFSFGGEHLWDRFSVSIIMNLIPETVIYFFSFGRFTSIMDAICCLNYIIIVITCPCLVWKALAPRMKLDAFPQQGEHQTNNSSR